MNQTILRATILGLALFSTAACKKKQPATDTSGQPALEGNVFTEGFSEQSIAGNLSTSRPAVEFDAGCTGFVGEAPTFEFTIPEALPMRISALADIDTSLVIEGPEGPHCNDDYKDRNPSIGQIWPAGEYRLWLGSYEAQSEAFFYEVNFEHFDPNAEEEVVDPFAGLNEDAPRAPEPTPLIPTESINNELLQTHTDVQLGTYHLAPRAAATDIEFTVGSAERQPAGAVHESCAGDINYHSAEAIIAHTGGGPLNIIVETQVDSTLLVRGPGGVWCADDTLGTNPAILIEEAQEGRYFLFFGTKAEGEELIQGKVTMY